MQIQPAIVQTPHQSVGTGPFTLVLGVGDILSQDEGAGVRALELLEQQYGDLPQVDFLDGGTRSFSLVAAIEACAALVVLDAAELQSPPGTIRVFEGEEMDDFLGSNRKHSVAKVGLQDLLAVAALAGSLPSRRALVGIQPAVVGCGEAPSPIVAQALPVMAGQAADVIMRWRR